MIRIGCTLQFHASRFPLLFHRHALKRAGIGVEFLESCDLSAPKAYSRFDYMFLSNRLYGRQFSLDEVRSLSTLGSKIFWFDETASTGTTNFEVLPFVDRYLKRQLLRDTSQYAERWYRRRIFTDYYHRRFGVTDSDPHYTETALQPEFAHKLGVYWNLAYKDYRTSFRRLRNAMRRYTALPFLKPALREPSDGCRTIDVFARMSTSAFAPSVGYQRREILRLLDGDASGATIAHRGTVPKSQYDHELATSRIVVSPFGWGEICYRDFEAMVNGACLIKPDVSHLTTWPEVYVENQTYIPCRWDLTDFASALSRTVEGGETVRRVADAAQRVLKTHFGDAGAAPFVGRVQSLLAA